MADDVTEYLLKAPSFDELIQSLDHLIAVSNNGRLVTVSEKGDAMAGLAYMDEGTAEMAVV